MWFDRQSKNLLHKFHKQRLGISGSTAQTKPSMTVIKDLVFYRVIRLWYRTTNLLLGSLHRKASIHNSTPILWHCCKNPLQTEQPQLQENNWQRGYLNCSTGERGRQEHSTPLVLSLLDCYGELVDTTVTYPYPYLYRTPLEPPRPKIPKD